MRRIAIEGTPVRSIGYDPSLQVLEIEWRSGRVYQYFAVPEGVHAWLMRSRDKIGIVERMVKDRYEFLDVTEPDERTTEDLADALARSLAALEQRRRDRGELP